MFRRIHRTTIFNCGKTKIFEKLCQHFNRIYFYIDSLFEVNRKYAAKLKEEYCYFVKQKLKYSEIKLGQETLACLTRCSSSGSVPLLTTFNSIS